MDQSLVDKIRFLYPERADYVCEQVQQILDDFEAEHPELRSQPLSFSERDVVLICYGDHVQQPGVPTLQTLHAFLRDYVANVIPRVHILPFFPYSSDDGFSVIDYRQVNPAFGNWSDVQAIARDVQLMFDLVINHVSAESEWFQRFLKGDAEYQDYFIAFEQPVDVSSVFRPRTHPLLTRFSTARGDRYVWTTFSADQIDGNFSNPEVLLTYLRIVLFYLAQGARVIRLDAIAYLWKQLGTSCLHLLQTHQVVKLLRQILGYVAPGVWIITETNVPHYDNVSYFGNGVDEAHLVYNFALPPLLLLSFLQGEASALTRWAQTLTLPSPQTAFFNFTASHDGVGVTALRQMVPEEEFRQVVAAVEQRGGKIGYRSVPGQEPVPYELNVVYLDAVGGVEPFIASQAIALSLQGVPAIYFNSLIGAQNWEEGVAKLGYNRAINRQKFDDRELRGELESPDSTKHRVYQALRRLLEVRQNEPLFNPAVPQTVLEIEPRLFAVLRGAGEQKLLALVNVSGDEVRVEASRLQQALGRDEARDLVTGEVTSLREELVLHPYQVLWLK